MDGCCLVSGGIGGSAAVDSKGVRTVTRRVGCMNISSTFVVTGHSTHHHSLIHCIQTAEAYPIIKLDYRYRYHTSHRDSRREKHVF